MTEHTTKTAMTTPTTAEQTEPAIKWAQSLLHHAAFPDPVSMYCAIPAQSVEAAARYLASVERENEDARATIARLEGEIEQSNRLLGEALLRADRLQSDANARSGWLREAKQQRGFDDNVSFDVVWKDVCTRADAAERRVEAMAKGLKAVEALISESRGVIGLHLNGDDAPWEDLRTGGSFEEWMREFDAALAAASGDTATKEGGR